MYGDNMTSYEVIYLTTLYWSLLMLLKSPHIDPDHILEKLFACVVVRRLSVARLGGCAWGSFTSWSLCHTNQPSHACGRHALNCHPYRLAVRHRSFSLSSFSPSSSRRSQVYSLRSTSPTAHSATNRQTHEFS